MATQAERRKNTRAVIVAAATDLFSRDGFAETSVSGILDAAGISRGALYHHFESKEEVFAAVYAGVSSDAVRRAGLAARHVDSPLDALIGGCLAWIDITAEAATARILFAEGPKALGWARCRDLEEAASLGTVRAGLALIRRAGEVPVRDLDMTARLINAAIAEAALSIHAGKPRATRAAAHRTISALISGLLVPDAV